MTPSLLMRASHQLQPLKSKIIFICMFSLLAGLTFLAFMALLGKFSLIPFLLAWSSLGIGMLCFGVSLIIFLYSSNSEKPSNGIAPLAKYYWNRLGLTIAAPFFTLWILGITIIIPCGIVVVLFQKIIY